MEDDPYEEIKSYFILCETKEEARKLLLQFPGFKRHFPKQFQNIDE